MNSERIDQLDAPSEVFYRRLMSKVDDHGLYDARPSILRASLYPLRVDRVREADIARWIAACEKAGVIALYYHDGKPFLQMLDTRWKVRSEPKFPLRTVENTCVQSRTPVALDGVGDGVVVSSEAKASGGKPPKEDLSPDAILFGYGVPYLVEAGSKETHARSFIGKLRKLHGDNAVIDKLRACLKLRPSQPVEWLAAALPPEKAPPKVEWFETQSGIEERGEELGLGRWDEAGWKSRGFMPADGFSAYKARVMAAHSKGAQ